MCPQLAVCLGASNPSSAITQPPPSRVAVDLALLTLKPWLGRQRHPGQSAAMLSESSLGPACPDCRFFPWAPPPPPPPPLGKEEGVTLDLGSEDGARVRLPLSGPELPPAPGRRPAPLRPVRRALGGPAPWCGHPPSPVVGGVFREDGPVPTQG